MNQNIFIVSTGCPECVIDANLLESYLLNKGPYTIVTRFKKADCIIVLGCAVTQYKEKYTYAVIDYLNKNKNTGCELLVLGCISKINTHLFAKRDNSRFDIDELDKLTNGSSPLGLTSFSCYKYEDNELLKVIRRTKSVYFSIPSDIGKLPLKRDVKRFLFNIGFRLIDGYKDILDTRILSYNRKTACLRISMGCQNNCSYCAIKIARGKVKSQPLESIKSQITSLSYFPTVTRVFPTDKILHFVLLLDI